MKIKDLIEHLQKEDPDLPVYVFCRNTETNTSSGIPIENFDEDIRWAPGDMIEIKACYTFIQKDYYIEPKYKEYPYESFFASRFRNGDLEDEC